MMLEEQQIHPEHKKHKHHGHKRGHGKKNKKHKHHRAQEGHHHHGEHKPNGHAPLHGEHDHNAHKLDKYLVERWLHGDRSARQKLINAWYGIISRYARRVLRKCPVFSDAHIVDQLIDSAFRLAFHYAKEYTANGSFGEFVLDFLRTEVGHYLKHLSSEFNEVSADNLSSSLIAKSDGVEHQIKQAEYTEQAQEAYRFFTEVWCHLQPAKIILYEMRSDGLDYKDIVALDVSKMTRLSEDYAEALRQIQSHSLARLPHIFAETKRELHEGYFNLHLCAEARETGKSRVAILNANFPSHQERFVLQARVIGGKSFSEIAEVFKKEFSQDVTPTQLEHMYFECVSRYLKSRKSLGIREAVREIFLLFEKAL